MQISQLQHGLQRTFTTDGHRLVFWYDAPSHFMDALEELALNGVQILNMAGKSTFGVKLRHYADQRISLGPDDRVKVNYGKFGDLLAEVKAATGESRLGEACPERVNFGANNRRHHMKSTKLKISFLVTFFVLSSSIAFADGLYGSGDNFGGGWQSDGMGGVQGTGDNFGRGYQADGLGGVRGTVDNFGRGYQSDGMGGYRGTGDNFGSGWQPDGTGGYRGTGENFGSGWQSDGMGGYRGTGDNFGSGYQRR